MRSRFSQKPHTKTHIRAKSHKHTRTHTHTHVHAYKFSNFLFVYGNVNMKTRLVIVYNNNFKICLNYIALIILASCTYPKLERSVRKTPFAYVILETAGFYTLKLNILSHAYVHT